MRGLIALAVIGFAVHAQDTAERGVGIIRAHCAECHGTAAMGGLNLATRETAIRGGGRGPALLPGNSAKSLLVEAVMQNGKLKMPPGRKLAESDIAALRNWIDAGASYPSPVQASTWWAFRKPVRQPLPEGSSNPIDGFIDATILKQHLTAAPGAGRATLIRRAYLDLHGLPPAAADIAAFVNDQSPNAYQVLIDKLLASPRYGEKWGRFWLDLVRYADTAGFEMDPYVADAWRYRDYRSVNK